MTWMYRPLAAARSRNMPPPGPRSHSSFARCGRNLVSDAHWNVVCSGMAATGETGDDFSRGERTYHPGRPGHTNGRHPAALLAAGLAVARDSEAGLSTGARAPAGRGPGRLPRHQRAHRAGPGIMPASPRFTVFWPERRVRPALRLSRLEIRRRWQLRRHDE